MICDADTIGVFQIESRAQMSRLRPRKYYDLVVQVAIVRPGRSRAAWCIPTCAGARQGRRNLSQRKVRDVLSRTMGVPIFQEQVMQIAVVAAGFTPGDADQLRRSMAAWKRKGGVDKYRVKLVGGLLAHGYTLDFAEALFRQIEGFGEYGFPESHAASFALLAYASSWLKRHEPEAFLAALLNSAHGLLRAGPVGAGRPSPWRARAAARRGAQRLGLGAGNAAARGSRHPRRAHPHAPPAGEPRPAVRLGLSLVQGLREEAARRIEARARRRPMPTPATWRAAPRSRGTN